MVVDMYIHLHHKALGKNNVYAIPSPTPMKDIETLTDE